MGRIWCHTLLFFKTLIEMYAFVHVLTTYILSENMLNGSSNIFLN